MTTIKDPAQFLLAEYRELRSEILKRMEIQHQLVSIALVALAALVSVGFKDDLTVLLTYPLLAVFLSAVWSYNDIRIQQIGAYIQVRIETQLSGSNWGWEYIMAKSRASKLVGSRTILATRGILMGTEILTVFLYLLNHIEQKSPALPRGDIALLVLDVIAIVFTSVILWRYVARQEIVKSMQKVDST